MRDLTGASAAVGAGIGPRTASALANVGIVTTKTTPFGRPSIDTPRDRAQLIDLLTASTFLPGITGAGWSHGGRLDGGLSASRHPWPRADVVRCPRALHGGLRAALDCRSTSVSEALKTYEAGREAGRRAAATTPAGAPAD